MSDQNKNKEELVNKLMEMRQKKAELEASLVTLKHREEAGQEAQATCKAVIEAFDGLIYVCSSNYEVEFMNERFIQRTGYNPIGEKCYQALHDRDEICPWCVNDRVQRGETVRWGTQSPKDNRWYYVVDTPVRHRDGTISKMAMIQDVTERKQAEEALRESQERLQLALNGADLGLWDYNLETGEAFISQRRAEMVGYSVDELEPCISSWGSMVHPDDLERVVEAFNAHAKGETPFYECEHRLRCKSGEYIWVLARAKIVERDTTGSPGPLTGTSLDITDRKRAEEALRKAKNELELKVQERTAELKTMNEELLRESAERKAAEEVIRESEQRYRLLADNTSDVIWQTDLDQRFNYVNPAIARVTGYTVDEWIGTRLTEHCDEENFMKMAQVASEEISKGADSSGTIFEAVMLKKNKEPISVEIHGKVIWGENGLPIALQGVARDITERKQAEEALRLSEERYRTVADFTYDWEYWTEPDGNLLYVSPSCERITDYSAQEFLDDPGLMERIVHPDDRTNVSNHFHNARKIDYERSYSLDFRIIRRDGQTRWISHACRPVHGNEGQPLGRRASNRDITDRKRAEEALKESEEWYRSIVEESFDGIFVQKGPKIVYANSRSLRDAWLFRGRTGGH